MGEKRLTVKAITDVRVENKRLKTKLEKIEKIIKKYGLADVTRDDVGNTVSGFEYEIIREVLEDE